MATAKVKQFWTAFISVLFALLASVGLASTATAAQAPAVQQPEEPAAASAAATGARAATVSVPAQRAAYQWPTTVRERSLPPTIKQRIGAEAHNSSPSVRHLRADAPTETALTDQTELSDLALAAAA
ncbi:DUF6344 domain-containing protein [Streptomyces sp. P9(2023)]|uniref:DUF6344 domain-containing protein n=1 Tax=Streptomyces sp. P9(2023) TaxID=3064394 RepID=UPI0028F452DE|nr:DUF6344 domain-containing protein [Streptomyces sp. P9(2023)]MDT9690846.1 DUF6344 domain-containing protein [Streptomyces sp. P9(2023)]